MILKNKLFFSQINFLLLFAFLFLVFLLMICWSGLVSAQSIGGVAAESYFYANGSPNLYTFYQTYDSGACYFGASSIQTLEANQNWISPAGNSTVNQNYAIAPSNQPFSFQLNAATVFCHPITSGVEFPNDNTTNFSDSSSNPNPQSFKRILSPPPTETVYQVNSAYLSGSCGGNCGSVIGANFTLDESYQYSSGNSIPHKIYFASSPTMTYYPPVNPPSSVRVTLNVSIYNVWAYSRGSGLKGCVAGSSPGCYGTISFNLNFQTLPSPILPPPPPSGGGGGNFTSTCNSRAGPVTGILNYTFPNLPPGAYNPTYSVTVNKYYQSVQVNSYYQSYNYNSITFVTPSTLHSQNPPPGGYYYSATTNYNYWYNKTIYYWYENSTGWHIGSRTIAVQQFGPSNTVYSKSVTCDYKPYFKIQSGDIVAGSNICSTLSSSTTNATISSYSADTTSAGSEYAAIATGTISNFVSGQGLYGSLTSPLTFSNTSGNNGNFGTSPCLTNYFNPPSSSSGPNTYTINATSPFYIPAITTTINPGQHYTYYVNGNVIINHNITFAGAVTNPAQIPSFNLIVNGNIYIDSTVTQLDGLYQALGSGSSGNIYDCYPFNTTNYLSCSTPLTINGSMMAQNTVHLDRTASGLIIPPYPGYPGNSTENFNLSPWLWFDQINNNSSGTPPYNENNNQLQYASLTSLPPIY